MRRAAGPWLRLLGLATVLAGAAAILVHAGRGPLAGPPVTDPAAWSRWSRGVEPVQGALALVRLAALGACAYGLVAVTAGVGFRLAAAARPSAWVARSLAAADRLTVGPLRQLLAATAGLALAAGPPLAATVGRAPPAAAATVTAEVPGPGPTTGTGPAGPPSTLVMRLIPPPPAPGPPAPAPLPAVAGADEGEHVVRRGECFWSIAHDVLEGAWGRHPGDAEIVPYWQALVAANGDRLADPANPDLVYPGQVFRVPPPPAAG